MEKNRFGSGVGAHFGAKIDLGSHLERLIKGSMIMHPPGSVFQLLLTRFLSLLGAKEEGASINDTMRGEPLKTLIFLRKNTNSTTSRGVAMKRKDAS